MGGRAAPAVTRRIGGARQTLRKLEVVWTHANMCKMEKKRVLDACVVSKLLYGLDSVLVLKADRKRPDAF